LRNPEIAMATTPRSMSGEIDRGKLHDMTAVDQGWVYLAMNCGKARKAARRMAENGLEPIPPATLDYWKRVAHVEMEQRLRTGKRWRNRLTSVARWSSVIEGRASFKRLSASLRSLFSRRCPTITVIAAAANASGPQGSLLLARGLRVGCVAHSVAGAGVAVWPFSASSAILGVASALTRPSSRPKPPCGSVVPTG
jgi:hypothetical protein